MPVSTGSSLYNPYCYVNFVVDPVFNTSWLDSANTPFYSDNTYAVIPTGDSTSRVYGLHGDYSNFRSEDIYSVASTGLLRCDLDLSNDLLRGYNFYRWEIAATDFFAQSVPHYDLYSEFCIRIPYDYHYLFVENNSNAFVKLRYRRLNSSGNVSNDDIEYTEVSVPLSDFLFDDELIIDPGIYLNSLNQYGIYHIQDFYVSIPCSITVDTELNLELLYYYNQEYLDPYQYVVPHSPRLELSDYTDWITSAVDGILTLQVFPGFYLSGLLMVIIAFCCVMWFLKIFAGG